MPDTGSDTAPRPGTRERLIAAMADALQRRGLHGVGLNELLASADAPKGVLYHHFPGGKTELAVAAVQATVQALQGRLDHLLASRADPADALAAWMAGLQKQMHASDFVRGCPLATAALETGPDDVALRQALAQGFDTLRGRLGAALAAAGVPAARAPLLATLVVSAYEGALIQARVAGQVQPLADTAAMLVALVRQELPPKDTP